jgi:hypothetical protein
MIKTLFLSMTLVAVALAGCGDKDKDDADKGGEAAKAGEGAGGSLDQGQAFALERGQENLKEVKDALAAGEDTDIKCAAALGYAEQLEGIEDEGAKALLTEARAICRLDAPLATAEREIAEAEQAREAEPDKQPLSECFNANISMAFKTLEEHHADDGKFAALKERFAAVCPDQAE